MKPRLYFDTSVFGGIYDVEFEKETKQIFKMVAEGEIVCLYSDLTVAELETLRKKSKDIFKKFWLRLRKKSN